MNLEIPSQFEGCAFVFLSQGAPAESPYSLRWDNFAGVDLCEYLFDMKAALRSSNVVPLSSFWRQERRKARG